MKRQLDQGRQREDLPQFFTPLIRSLPFALIYYCTVNFKITAPKRKKVSFHLSKNVPLEREKTCGLLNYKITVIDSK